MYQKVNLNTVINRHTWEIIQNTIILALVLLLFAISLFCFSVDYLIVKPLKELKCDMQYSYARHWRKEKSLDVGHRGMGSSHTTKTK